MFLVDFLYSFSIIFYILLECLLYLVIPVLIGLAFLTLAERKIMAYLQQRRGPNVEGFLGVLQPI